MPGRSLVACSEGIEKAKKALQSRNLKQNALAKEFAMGASHLIFSLGWFLNKKLKSNLADSDTENYPFLLCYYNILYNFFCYANYFIYWIISCIGFVF